jgi:predicted dehydrogenase
LLIQTTEHLPALVTLKAKLKAVYSRSAKTASNFLSESKKLGVEGIELYSEDTPGHTLGDLLRRQDIKAVIIVLPIPVQPDIIRRCFAAGKHVLSEKPIAKDVSTARLLLEDYKKEYASNGIIFNIAEQFRYIEGVELARKWIVDEKAVGQLNQVHLRIWRNVKAGGKYYETEWRKSPQYQGGFILDGGIHHVAQLRYVSGQEIIETRGFARQVAAHMPPLDTVNAGILLSGGATGTFSMSFASTKSATENIFIGTKGSLTITGSHLETILKLEDVAGNTIKDLAVKNQGVEQEIKAFLNAVEAGNSESRAGPEEALNDLAVIESLCSGGGKVTVVEI